MAHNVLGIDLGAYSVKVAELSAGFRQARLVGLYEKRLLPREEGESELARRARTLKALLDEEELKAEMCATTLGGEAVLRLLELPFSERKKIEQILRYELESQVLGDVEDMVLDFVVAEPGQGGHATKVIAVAAEQSRVKDCIDALSAVGVEPRAIGAAALSYAALRGHAFGAAEGGPVLVLDVGHRHTHACVVDGEAVRFARSIPRGGEDVTRALAETFRMSLEAAERAKPEQAYILEPGQAAESTGHRRVDEAVRGAVRPLMRELRQTLAAYRAGGAAAPIKVLLTGGGARLSGFAAHLEQELELPVSLLVLAADDPFVSPVLRTGGDGLDAEAATFAGLPAQALGLAIAVAQSVPQVNLRKGELAFKTDYSYLRGKAGTLALGVMAVLLFAGLNALASLRALKKEGEALEFQLRKATIELFGERRTDGKEISDELRQGPKGGAPPAPSITAFDLLDELSRAVPPNDKAKLDLFDLDIRPKKTIIRGHADSVAQVEALVEALEKIECFTAIEKGKIASVNVPPSGENPKGDKPYERKEFTLTITTTCP
jgi:general secretion pathway protein L